MWIFTNDYISIKFWESWLFTAMELRLVMDWQLFAAGFVTPFFYIIIRYVFIWQKAFNILQIVFALIHWILTMTLECSSCIILIYPCELFWSIKGRCNWIDEYRRLSKRTIHFTKAMSWGWLWDIPNDHDNMLN